MLWQHLPMNPEDDPEARIRQLEQPLANSGVELGTTDPAATPPTSPLPPPVYAGPYQPPYDQSPYAAPPFGVAYPQVAKSGVPVGLVLAMIGVVAVLIVAGIGAVVWMVSSSNPGTSARPVGSGSFDDVPTWVPPSFPSVVVPTEQPPQVAVAPAGENYSISGVDNVETVECNGSEISISGVNNTVTLLGHCLSVNVSGVENNVELDSADRISASGFDNEVIYHSGEPEVAATSRNIVAKG